MQCLKKGVRLIDGDINLQRERGYVTYKQPPPPIKFRTKSLLDTPLEILKYRTKSLIHTPLETLKCRTKFLSHNPLVNFKLEKDLKLSLIESGI